MAREFFQCYHSYLQQMSSLSDAEFGRLIREALKYSSTGQSDPLPGKEDVVFPFIAYNIDREKQAYEEKCKKNREIKLDSLRRTITNDNERYRTITKEKEEDKEQEKEYLPTEEREAHTCEDVTVSDIVRLYHTICKSFPKVLSLSDKRKKAINARLNTYTAEQFREMFTKAENSSFLKGANDRDWTATFDWLITDANFAKVLDGNYDYKPQKPAAKKPPKTRYTPNPTRDTSECFEISAAIMEAEMKGRTEEEERRMERSRNAIHEALERGKA